MRGDPLVETLVNPSVKAIRDCKISLWRRWQDENDMPGEIIVRRGYDITQDRRTAIVIVRSAIPRHFVWREP